MQSTQIREAFLQFFKDKGHEIVSSSPLIPAQDPTLLFTNAGMVQFKDVFLGREPRPYTRAASVQRCVRAGGKHNDLENVGYTARHHTFFEMLGNFSFGDYFKREAIQYAWEFLTQVLQIPPAKLWITVFEEDDEAAAIWLDEIKIDPSRFSRCGEKDNFWAMGDTGPCGPCSEIFYDHGPEVAGGPPGTPEADGDRYVEIWNLVFMQYNRLPNGEIHKLPKPSVDTGMGFERIAAVMQGVQNNFDIDLFQRLIHFVADLANTKDYKQTSLRVVADHIRSAAFLMTDGVTPSNEGRGYVLRRIIRRAIRHGNKLGLREPFFHKLVEPLVAEMGQAYPELTKAQDRIKALLQREEELFAQTLEQGLRIFEQEVKQLTSAIIPGDIVFRLYDTYGFPLDLTADIARERNLEIDEPGFHKAMEQQRSRSQEASRFSAKEEIITNIDACSHFTGYENLVEQTKVLGLIKDGKELSQLDEGSEGIVVLEHTPFYAESGGQIGDRGVLSAEGVKFVVTDTQKQGQLILHYGKIVNGQLLLGMNVEAKVDVCRRQAAASNHSATHLLNAALRRLLGEHVIQKGSLVEPERLRFDFSHFEPLSSEDLRTLEHLVNAQIRANHKVETKLMTPEEAMDSGAMALFGEKYGDEVRVLCMGDFSMELCGGTHVANTGDIGLFKITAETGIASGIRRIEAVTGQYALDWVDAGEDQLKRFCQVFKVGREGIAERIEQITAETQRLEKELAKLKSKLAHSAGTDLLNEVKTIAEIQVLSVTTDATEMKALREILDHLKQKLPKSVIVLAAVEHEKINLVSGVSPELVTHIKANELLNYVAAQVDGKGGGRPDAAQGGGTNIAALPQALESVYEWVKERVK